MAGDEGFHDHAVDERGDGAVDGQPDPSYLVATTDVTDLRP